LKATRRKAEVSSGSKADLADRSGVSLLYPKNRTSALRHVCQQRAISGLMHRSKGLFDDLVGQREQLIRDFQVKRLGGLHVEYPRRKHSYT
jgi:hypothetical protein